MQNLFFFPLLVAGAALVFCLRTVAAESVAESARKIPVAYDVDVVVIGGSTGGVAAAAEAARNGAKVFLAAPKTYLGDDVTATLRVWLDGEEELRHPLARKLFGEGGRADTQSAVVADRLDFVYKADRPSAAAHPDTAKPSRLTDGAFASATKESVQYDGAVNIIADLGEATEIEKAVAYVFHAKDFLVDRVTISTSDNQQDWREIQVVRNSAPASDETRPALALGADVKARARYVRFAIQPATESKRVLVGELILVAPPGRTASRAEAGTSAARPAVLVRPLHIKRALDEALIEAGVQYLYGCFVTDLLRDAQGNPAGVVMANRAGRQAVRAKVIVDATDRAWVARMAGAETTPYPAGEQVFKRVVVGGQERKGAGVAVRKLPANMDGFPVFEYTLRLPMKDGSYRSFAEAEQRARDLTAHPDMKAAADRLFQVPPDAIRSVRAAAGDWPGADRLDLDALKPKGIERLFVLGACADLPRPQAERLANPVVLIDLGTRVGAAAAVAAKAVPDVARVQVAGPEASASRGEIREFLAGVRPIQRLPTIDQPARALPVLGTFDVVVIGGGTAGAPAGIGAARQGARTLVVEFLDGLGGVGTLGRISKYYWGNVVGFTKSVVGGGSWSVEERAEWWRNEIRKAGGEIWFGAIGCGAFVEKDTLKGAVVATPQGRGVVLARTVIDATGAADVAAAGGAACIYTDANDVALQGTGLPPHTLGKDYTNTDYTIVDETDMLDVWRIFVFGKRMAGNAFDFGTLIDTRERRRIVGDFTIDIFDQVLSRTHPDTVVEAFSNFDTHGYTVDPYFTINYPHHKGLRTYIPYRAMLPKGMDGILVVGLGLSAHRDAVPVIRMQPDIQNGGYAAGVAAAMAAKGGTSVRKIDIKALQRHLVDIGNLKPDVLTAQDSFPLPADRIAAAVKEFKDPYIDTAIILSHPEQALPLVKQAYLHAGDDKVKLRWAQVLSVFGDATGLDTIVSGVEAHEKLDKGWTYVGMGQFGASMSPMDSLMYALGRIGDKRAVPVILKKLRQLEPGSEFSHFRAIAMALEKIGDPSAAGPLAEVLSKPGIRGQATRDIQGAIKTAEQHRSWTATAPRANALRELFLARALYRCGDKDGLGKKVLQEYTEDLHGHFARHADAVLKEGEGRK